MNQPKKLNRTESQLNQRQPVEILDVHGKTKEKAILSMTMFLSDCIRKHQHLNNEGVWVRIITGCGKHSSQGPILRNAVQATLDKREMDYVMDKWKGSFTVRADSGHPLTECTNWKMLDTKILIVSSLPQPTKSERADFPKPTLTTSVDSSPSLVDNHDPLPREVLHDDKSLQRAKELSLQSLSTAIERHGEKDLKEVIKVSKITYQLENEILRKEQQFLDEVLQVSVQEKDSKQKEEYLLLDKAISESMEEQRQWEKEEGFLEDAIAASLLHTIDYIEDDEISISMMKCSLEKFN